MNAGIVYYLAILQACQGGSVQRQKLVRSILLEHPGLSINELQHAINDLADAHLLTIGSGTVRIPARARADVDLLLAPEVDADLARGYLTDLHSRTTEITRLLPSKWVEFFLALVAVVSVVPILVDLFGISDDIDSAVSIGIIAVLGVGLWLLMFNNFYFNKRPDLIPLDVLQSIHSESTLR